MHALILSLLLPTVNAAPAVPADVAAACRATATLQGPGGVTRDPRLYTACLVAAGAREATPDLAWVPVDAPPSCPVDAQEAASAWEACLLEAKFVDASGWPHLDPRKARACMEESGWQPAPAEDPVQTPAERLVAAR